MFLAVFALLVTPAGEIAPPPIGTELKGRTTIAEFPDGSVVHMHYRPDGTFTGRLGARSWSGTYWFTDGKLCLRTSTEHECWPYAEPMVPGRIYDVTAPDGTKVKVRLAP